MYDTIIIGAGLSGLAAGIRLAYYEQRVCILERHYTIGGLNSFYRLRGRDYDVGLHAVTNFTPKGAKKGPLAKLLRQLRFSWEDFALAPQLGSAIAFPGVRLNFNNDIRLLESEVAAAFPKQRENFQRLQAQILDYDDLIAHTRAMLDRIEGLRDDPRPAGAEKLVGAELYRLRQGAYRIVYAIEDGRLVVIVVRIGQRRHVYRSA